jgi:hypothetical protein
LDAGALWDDAKVGVQDSRAWERIAIVSDKDWLKHTVKAFGWLVPGEVRVFELDDLDDAGGWASSRIHGRWPGRLSTTPTSSRVPCGFTFPGCRQPAAPRRSDDREAGDVADVLSGGRFEL